MQTGLSQIVTLGDMAAGGAENLEFRQPGVKVGLGGRSCGNCK